MSDQNPTPEDLLDAAFDLPAEERLSYLTQHCNDPDTVTDVLEIVNRCESPSLDGFLTDVLSPAGTTTAGPPDSAATFPAATEQIASQRQAGEIVAGRYQIVACLGSGGFGVVHEAIDLFLNRPVALKEPHRVTPLVTEMIFSEALSASQIRNRYVVDIYTTFLVDQHPFIVMELVRGESLHQRLKSRGRMDPLVAAGLIRKVSSAILAGHAAGIYHRDLKPGNILLDEDDEPRVVDFGLAIQRSDRSDHEGEFAGSTAYMSPEQFAGRATKMDARADIWSLGAILYESIAGERPFKPGEQAEHDPPSPIPLRQIVAGVPRKLDELCLSCLAIDPEDRPVDAGEVEERLRLILRPRRSRRSLIALSAGILPLALATGYMLWPEKVKQDCATFKPQRVDLSNAGLLASRDRKASCQYVESDGTLQISSTLLTFIDLGRLTAPEQFEVFVEFEHEENPGARRDAAFGVYLGLGNPEGVFQLPSEEIQLIQIQLIKRRNKTAVERWSTMVSLKNSGIEFTDNGKSKRSIIGEQEGRNHSLFFRVGRAGLEIVTYNEVDLPSLLHPELNRAANDGHYDGQIGIVCANCRVVVKKMTLTCLASS